MVLYGPVQDQAGLGGLVDRILSSGLEVVEVRRLPITPDELGGWRNQHSGLGAVKQARYGRDMDLEAWAAVQAEALIAPLGDRWLHVRAVARQTRRVATVLPDEIASCWWPPHSCTTSATPPR
jgi:hypothetical protein